VDHVQIVVRLATRRECRGARCEGPSGPGTGPYRSRCRSRVARFNSSRKSGWAMAINA
jgi:hypothetical protein